MHQVACELYFLDAFQILVSDITPCEQSAQAEFDIFMR